MAFSWEHHILHWYKTGWIGQEKGQKSAADLQQNGFIPGSYNFCLKCYTA